MEKKGIVSEFKEFITRGNVMDMAVGIIIGGAFTAIVTALVDNIIMPIISRIFGGISFEQWNIVMGSGDEAPVVEVPEPVATDEVGSSVQAVQQEEQGSELEGQVATELTENASAVLDIDIDFSGIVLSASDLERLSKI